MVPLEENIEEIQQDIRVKRTTMQMSKEFKKFRANMNKHLNELTETPKPHKQIANWNKGDNDMKYGI